MSLKAVANEEVYFLDKDFYHYRYVLEVRHLARICVKFIDILFRRRDSRMCLL